MKIGYYIKKEALKGDARIENLLKRLEAGGVDLYEILGSESCREDTAMVLSFGGDGTFLSAAHRVCEAGLPILGINFGRMGFLAANSPEDAAEAILGGKWEIEELDMLKVECEGTEIPGFWPYAMNEVSLHRDTPAMLGVDVKVNGSPLPTYWSDGLLVATSSGSTAYSLSVGGPICMPDTKVLIIAPISPHNLNVRPLVVPDTARITISIQSRDDKAIMTMDNKTMEIDPSWTIEVAMAQFSLKRIRLSKSEFVKALTSRLFWGEDMRNNG